MSRKRRTAFWLAGAIATTFASSLAWALSVLNNVPGRNLAFAEGKPHFASSGRHEDSKFKAWYWLYRGDVTKEHKEARKELEAKGWRLVQSAIPDFPFARFGYPGTLDRIVITDGDHMLDFRHPLAEKVRQGDQGDRFVAVKFYIEESAITYKIRDLYYTYVRGGYRV